jgi:hypothetical protein
MAKRAIEILCFLPVETKARLTSRTGEMCTIRPLENPALAQLIAICANVVRWLRRICSITNRCDRRCQRRTGSAKNHMGKTKV